MLPRMAARAPERLPASAVFRNVFVVAGGVLLIYCLYLLRKLLMLVFIALFLAVGMDPAIRRLQGWGIRRGLSVTLILLGIVGFLAGFVAAVVPPLVDQVTEFATNLPEYVRDLAENNERIRDYVSEQNIAERLQDATQDIPAQIGSSFGTVVGVAGSVLATIFNTPTVLVLTIYFSLSFTRMREGSLGLDRKST